MTGQEVIVKANVIANQSIRFAKFSVDLRHIALFDRKGGYRGGWADQEVMCFKKFRHPLEQGPTNTFRFEELFRFYIEAAFHIANDIQRDTRAFLFQQFAHHGAEKNGAEGLKSVQRAREIRDIVCDVDAGIGQAFCRLLGHICDLSGHRHDI